MIIKCPTCDLRVEWTSNDDMEQNHGWTWATVQGEQRLICPECTEESKHLDRAELMGIGSAEQRRGRYGSYVNERTEGS